MNILIITALRPTESNSMGGIFVTRRIKRLQECGIQCHVVSFYIEDCWLIGWMKRRLNKKTDKKEPYHPQIKRDGVTYNFIKIKLAFFDHIFYTKFIGKIMGKGIKKSIRLEDYDIIHSHWVYPHGYAASLLKTETGIPCIITAHGSDIHTNPKKRPDTKEFTIFALENANYVIFVSNKLVQQAKELGYSGKNAVVIPNGVNTKEFFPRNKDEARTSLGLPDNSTYVGYVGNLLEVKGADRLPEIFSHIKKKVPGVEFIVIGDGILRPQIAHDLSMYSIGDSALKGMIEPADIPTWMNALDVLIMPSREEGFGIVALEAQACGVPVVGSDAGGIPEAVGECGVIVKQGANFEERFAEAVIKILENPPDPDSIRKRALEFDLRRTVQKEIDVYYLTLPVEKK